MSFIVFSDLHLHEWPNYSSLNMYGMNTRLHQQLMVLQEMINFAVDNKVTTIVFCGDMIHKRGIITPPIGYVLAEFKRLVEGHSITYLSIIGNHDMYNQYFNSSHMFGSHKPLNGVHYQTDKETLRGHLNLFNTAIPGFIHQGIANVPMGSGYIVDEILTLDMIPPNIPMVYSGHYHTHTKVAPNLTIVGSMIAQNWNDANEEKGWLFCDSDDFTKFKFIKSSIAPMFRYGTLADLSVNPANNFLKITDVPKDGWEETKKKLLQQGALSVEFEVDKTAPKLLFPTIQNCDLPNMIENILQKKKLLNPEFRKLGEELKQGL